MNEKLIDCHAHLVYEDACDVCEKMEELGLCGIISAGTSPDDIEEVVRHAQAHAGVHCVIAYHPEYASNITQKDFEKLEELAKEPCVVGIGECGLDYHYSKDNIEDQKRVFLRQIKIAEKIGKPLQLHLREAEEDAIAILQPHVKNLKVIIVHCYSAPSEEITKKFVEMGAYISFAGNFTYKKYRFEDAKLVPRDRLLVETDSPYLAPVPLRGTKNHSGNVHLVAQRLAEILGEDPQTLKKQLRENAKRVFGI